METIDAFRMMELPSFSRKRFLHREQKSLDVGIENFVEVLFGDCVEGGEFSRPGICEENVDVAPLFLYSSVQAIQIGEIGHVALHRGNAFADLLNRRVEFALTAAGDKDVCALRNEALRRGQSDSAVASRDDGY